MFALHQPLKKHFFFLLAANFPDISIVIPEFFISRISFCTADKFVTAFCASVVLCGVYKFIHSLNRATHIGSSDGMGG